MVAVRLTTFEQLTPAELARWDAIQRARRELESPYFRPEFVAAVAERTHDVEVAILENEGRIAGFFPFQRGRLKIAYPVGGSLSDFHGLIAEDVPQLDFLEILARCGLRAWDFQSVPQEQTAVSKFAVSQEPTYFLDLSAGYAGYCRRRKEDGSETIEKTQRKLRRMIREEKMRFELRSSALTALDTLLTWKNKRYQSLGVVSPVQGPSTRMLLEGLLARQTPGLETYLSVVWAGDTPAAIGVTLRSGPAAHCWLIGFDEAYARFSPGLILLLQLSEQLAAAGVQRLHLGKGNERFKTSLATDQEPIAAGIAGKKSLVFAGLKSWRWCKERVKQSPLGAVVRGLQPVRYWLTYGSAK